MIVSPAMYALVSGPSATVPSVATTLTLTSSWGYTPPANTHTPASWASRTTAWAASATSGISSSGMKSIAPSSNEIKYRVISPLLSRPPAPAAQPATDTRPVETDRPARTHRPRRHPASLLQASFRNTGPGQLVRVTSCPADERDRWLLALDDVVNFEHFWLTGVDDELGENRHEACSERVELFL